MSNRIITVIVSGEIITASSHIAGAAGSSKAVSLALSFDDAWDGLSAIKLYFADANGENPVFILLDATMKNASGAYVVPVPAEPLTAAGEMTLNIRGVYIASGGTNAERVMMAAHTKFTVLPAETPSSDVSPIEPTATQAEQIQANVAKVTGMTASVTEVAPTEATSVEKTVNADGTYNFGFKLSTGESARQSAEAARVSAEEARAAAESSRTSAENTRVSNETSRVNAESSRASAESSRTGAEQDRASAETARANAETARAEAESSRAAAENSRAAAENSRAAAENQRNNAETARAAAETERESFEDTREASAAAAAADAVLSQSWAVGNTNSRAGEDTNNSKYFSEVAKTVVKTGGETWVSTTMPGSDWERILYGNGIFVASGDHYQGTLQHITDYRQTAYSFDGKTWSDSKSWSQSKISIAYGNGKFVLVASGSASAFYSENGNVWTEVAMPVSASWYEVIYGGGKFVAVAYGSATAAYSIDGITWVAMTMPVSASWNKLAYGGGRFIALAFASTTAAYSTDGITWASATLPISNVWRTPVYGAGKFVLTGTVTKSASALYSTDGSSWKIATLPYSLEWTELVYGKNGFIAMTHGPSKMAHSVDGIVWTEISAPTQPQTGSTFPDWDVIAYGNGKYVVLGATGTFAYSSDGITWTSSELNSMTPPVGSWFDIIYANGMFVAVSCGKSDNGTFSVSPVSAYSQCEMLSPNTVDEICDKIDSAVTSADVSMAASAVSASGASKSASNAATSETNAAASASAAAASASNAATENKIAESWAVGGTGTRTGEDANNAKYWCQNAANGVFTAVYGSTAYADILAAYNAGKTIICKIDASESNPVEVSVGFGFPDNTISIEHYTLLWMQDYYTGSPAAFCFRSVVGTPFSNYLILAYADSEGIWSIAAEPFSYMDQSPTLNSRKSISSGGVYTALQDKLSLAGGTMTGALVLSGAPTTDLQAATKKYVDDAIGSAIGGSY
jgi:hypothetical protein